MSMTIESIKTFRILRPLAYQFTTSFSTREFISHVLTEMEWVVDEDCEFAKKGAKVTSYGESTTHSEPFYNGEFDQTVFCFHNRVYPYLVGASFECPKDLHSLLCKLKFNKQNRFAIAAFDIAFHDAFSQFKNLPLSEYLLLEYSYPSSSKISEVPVGVSRGMKDTPEELAHSVREFILAGNKKIKLKISPERDLAYIDAVRNVINSPEITLSADANASYDETIKDHVDRVLEIATKVDLLEQPFAYDDTWGHALLLGLIVKHSLKTRLVLDESIRTLKDIKNFISQVEIILQKPAKEFFNNIAINIKISRVGGLYEAMQIAKFCLDKGISIMPGGMHEFDFGQSAIVSFNSINSAFYPGDSEGSETYYAGSLTSINGERFTGLETNPRGNLTVPCGVGLGVGSLIWDELIEIGKNSYISSLDLNSGRWNPKWNLDLLEKVKKDISSQR